MKRFACPCFVLFCCLSFIPAAFAQTKTDSPAAGKWVTLRGTASIEFIVAKPKIANGEVQGVIRVKNVDNAPIVGLKIDEYFYSHQQEVSACTARVRSPIAAGEIIDVPISCPNPKEPVDNNNLVFTHANGKVQPKSVKKFADAAKK